VPKPWKCHHCKVRLGMLFGERIHVRKQELEAILRSSGEITLICPHCGVLNEIFFGQGGSNGQT
jgi:hypothetical protein